MCNEKEALKKGLTLSTAKWICELARELRVDYKKLLKAIEKMAKQGVFLDADDWRFIARFVDLNKHMDMIVDYIARRVASGVLPAQAVKELPEAVAKAGKLEHVKRVLEDVLK